MDEFKDPDVLNARDFIESDKYSKILEIVLKYLQNKSSSDLLRPSWVQPAVGFNPCGIFLSRILQN